MTRAQAELAAMRHWHANFHGNALARIAFVQGYLAALDRYAPDVQDRHAAVPQRQSGALPMPARSVAASTPAVRVGGPVGNFLGSIVRALGGGRQ